MRNPITGERPDFTEIIARTVGNEAGSYLISVNVEVKILEKAATEQSETVARNLPKGKGVITSVNPQKLLAS